MFMEVHNWTGLIIISQVNDRNHVRDCDRSFIGSQGGGSTTKKEVL